MLADLLPVYDSSYLIRLTSNYFCAGVVLVDDRVWAAAPIVKYMKGWHRARVLEYARKKKWRFEELKENPAEAGSRF